ncbi:MAG: hypothetical protein AAB277_02960, partial [Planctomycetota bacterium]
VLYQLSYAPYPLYRDFAFICIYKITESCELQPKLDFRFLIAGCEFAIILSLDPQSAIQNPK